MFSLFSSQQNSNGCIFKGQYGNHETSSNKYQGRQIRRKCVFVFTVPAECQRDFEIVRGKYQKIHNFIFYFTKKKNSTEINPETKIPMPALPLKLNTMLITNNLLNPLSQTKPQLFN